MSNQAKDWQTGTYVVSVYNNRVKVSRPKQGYDKPFIEAEARCDPEDEFSLSMGVTLAMDRLNKQLESANKEIKVGDRVLVTDPTKAYTTYVEWVIKHVQDITNVAMYRYNALPDYNIVGKVIAVDNNKNETLAYIEEDWRCGIIGAGCWLINTKGIKKL